MISLLVCFKTGVHGFLQFLSSPDNLILLFLLVVTGLMVTAVVAPSLSQFLQRMLS